MKSVRLFDDEGLEIGFELLAEDITKLSNAMERIKKTRISRKLLIAILHDDTKMTKGAIETVLDSLELMEKRYLNAKGK